MRKINWFRLIISIIICQSAGWIGSIATITGVNSWYLTLTKPSFNPPSWVFAPVWTALFILMGISLYLIWQSKHKNQVRAAIVFLIQLGLNILWSFLFFYFQNPLAAFIEIIILWIFILLSIIYFYKINKIAAYLLIPYILWVSFAAFLNFNLYLLN